MEFIENKYADYDKAKTDHVIVTAAVTAATIIVKNRKAIGQVFKNIFGNKKADPASAQTQADMITARDALLIRNDTIQDDIAQWNSFIWDSFQILDQAKLHKGGYPNASYFIWQVGAKSAKGKGSMWSYTKDRGEEPTDRLAIVDINQKAFQDPSDKHDFDYPNFKRVSSMIPIGIVKPTEDIVEETLPISKTADTQKETVSSDSTIKAGFSTTTMLILVGVVIAVIIFMRNK
jgi:hypothetical protein